MLLSMLDFLKFRTFDQTVINRLLSSGDFNHVQSKDHYIYYFQHKKYSKIKLEFRKSSKNLAENEFTYVDLFISPHYHFNKYKHNGNDFTPENCKHALQEICSVLKINPSEYSSLQCVNLEYGINMVPKTGIKNLLSGMIYFKRTPFICSQDFPYFKITDTSSYKQIKAYGKGMQFMHMPEYGIDINTLRFEIRNKEAVSIRKLGIHSLNDLLHNEVDNRLAQSLLDEWEHFLIVNIEPDLSGFTAEMTEYITQAKEIEFWAIKRDNNYRNRFLKEKEKYYRKSQKINNLHRLLKTQIIDKLFDLTRGANSTNKTPMKSRFFKIEKNISPR